MQDGGVRPRIDDAQGRADRDRQPERLQRIGRAAEHQGRGAGAPLAERRRSDQRRGDRARHQPAQAAHQPGGRARRLGRVVRQHDVRLVE